MRKNLTVPSQRVLPFAWLAGLAGFPYLVAHLGEQTLWTIPLGHHGPLISHNWLGKSPRGRETEGCAQGGAPGVMEAPPSSLGASSRLVRASPGSSCFLSPGGCPSRSPRRGLWEAGTCHQYPWNLRKLVSRMEPSTCCWTCCWLQPGRIGGHPASVCCKNGSLLLHGKKSSQLLGMTDVNCPLSKQVMGDTECGI